MIPRTTSRRYLRTCDHAVDHDYNRLTMTGFVVYDFEPLRAIFGRYERY